MNAIARLTMVVSMGFCLSGATLAAEAIKIGLILPMTGPYAAFGKQLKNGVDLYLQKNGDTYGGRKVEILLRDDGGAQPDVAKRLAQELIIKDNVDILAGLAFSPVAYAVAPLSAETKKPMVVMNGASSGVITKSPYSVRVSHTLPQVTAPIAAWANKNNIKSVITAVADYGPGIDAEKQFIKTYAAGGGQVIESLRIPLKNADLGPFLQKVKDSKPEAVFLFVPPGELSIAFLKGYRERDLAKAGIRLIGPGDMMDEDTIESLGDAAIGAVTSFHYSDAHNSAENKAFTAAYAKAYPKDRPNFMAVAGYDGMHVIAEALNKTGGDASGDKFIEAAKGLKYMSPKGPVTIDPVTRDIVQTVYIRRVERIKGKLVNVEFDDSWKEQRDPGQ